MGLEPGKEMQDLRSASTPGAKVSKRLGAGLCDSKGAQKTNGVGEPAWKLEEREPSDLGVWK